MSESTAIVRSAALADLDEVQRAAKLMLASGYFEAQRDPAVGVAQLATKILAGRELGYGPFASVQGIHVIQGKPALSANLMAAAVKASPRYDYRVRKMDGTECSIEFFERHGNNRELLGVSTFTVQDAKAAGVKNMDKFPRNMLFARALSNGVRWFCPDVFNGNTVYAPDELGATVDGDTGEIIDVEPQPQHQATPTPSPQSEPAPTPAASTPEPITDKQRRHLHAVGSQLYMADWAAKRHALVKAITKGRTESSTELTADEAQRLIDGIEEKLGEVLRAEQITLENVPELAS